MIHKSIQFFLKFLDIDRDRPKFPGLLNNSGGPSPMMTSLGGSINPSSLFMPPSAGLGAHLSSHHSHSSNNPFSSNNHLHHNSGGSSSGGSRSAESSPTAASSGNDNFNDNLMRNYCFMK